MRSSMNVFSLWPGAHSGFLSASVPAGALADKEPLGAPRQREDALIDERVVEHQVGTPQAQQRFSRQ